ncbi:hypothetical protein, partial [Xanthomonas phaseoli]|uniref:hypothetical protein n=2 Tax=Xanthomonas phaseoli TaxID=1985254 RepID=UPI00286941CC
MATDGTGRLRHRALKCPILLAAVPSMRFPFLSLSLAVSIALAGCSNDSTPSASPTAPAATAKAP